MKLKVIDGIQITSINTKPLTVGDVVDVADDLGAKLLKKHPGFFEDHGAKSAAPPKNKMHNPEANKAGAPKPDYEKQTVSDLKVLAESRKVDISHARNKGDVIAALVDADKVSGKPDYAALSDADLAKTATDRGIDVASLERRDDVVAALQLADEEAPQKQS